MPEINIILCQLYLKNKTKIKIRAKFFIKKKKKRHLPYHNPDVGFLPATSSAKTSSWLRTALLKPPRLMASSPH